MGWINPTDIAKFFSSSPPPTKRASAYYDADKRLTVTEKYRDLVNLSSADDFESNSFSKFMKDREKGLAKPATVFKSEHLAPVFKDAPDPLAKGIQSDIKGVLGASSEGMKKAQKEYEEVTGTFRGLVERDIPPEAIIGVMKQQIDSSVSDIKVSQKSELDSLSSLLKDENFNKKLTDPSPDGLGLDEEQATALKASMTTDLKAEHQKQLDAFTKSTGEAYNTVLTAAQTDMERIHFLVQLGQSKKMQEEYKAIVDGLNKDEVEALEAFAGGDKDTVLKANIGKIKMSDLKTIYTNSGKKIEQVEAGVYKMEFAAWLNPLNGLDNALWHFSGDIEKDMEALATAVAAEGHTHIEFDIVYDHPETAMKRAQQAYFGAVEAGFPIENIKVNVNGTLMDHKDLKKIFVDEHGNTDEEGIARLRNREKEVQALRQEKGAKFQVREVKELPSVVMDKAKEAVTAIREENRAKEEAAAAAAAKAKEDAEKTEKVDADADADADADDGITPH